MKPCKSCGKPFGDDGQCSKCRRCGRCCGSHSAPGSCANKYSLRSGASQRRSDRAYDAWEIERWKDFGSN